MDEQYDPNLYNPENPNEFEEYNEGEKIHSLGSDHEDPNNLEDNEQYQNQNIEDLDQYQVPDQYQEGQDQFQDEQEYQLWRRTKF